MEIRLARKSGKLLYELMGWDGPITHRQFLVEHMWELQDLNRPSKDNYYQMRIAYYIYSIIRMLSGKTPSLKFDDMRIKFKTGFDDIPNTINPQSVKDPSEENRPMTQKEIDQMKASKAAWFSFLGVGRKERDKLDKLPPGKPYQLQGDPRKKPSNPT